MKYRVLLLVVLGILSFVRVGYSAEGDNSPVISVDVTNPDPVVESTEKVLTVSVSPATSWASLCNNLSFELQNEKEHKCNSCGAGGAVADIVQLTDSSVSASDYKIKVKWKNNGHADLVVKLNGNECVRKSLRALTCPCGEKADVAGVWHSHHDTFSLLPSEWGDYGILDKQNPTGYNCFAYSMDVTDNYLLLGNYDTAVFDSLYRNYCGLKGYASKKPETKVILYGTGTTAQHAAKVYSCSDCPCDAISKWGWSVDSYLCCHPEDFFGAGSLYGSPIRYYVPFEISFSGSSVAQGAEKEIVISAKCGNDAVVGVKLECVIENNSKIEFVGWYGGNGNITDSAGEARLVIRGLETGNSDLTVKQKAEIFQSSGLSHKEEIQVVDPAP